MNKLSKIQLDSDQINLLPEINKVKVKSLSSSPKSLLPYQQSIYSPQPTSYPTNTFRNEDLVITQIKDKTKKERRMTIKPTKKSQETAPINQKYNQLSKVLVEKEAYINQLETKLFEQNSNTEPKPAETQSAIIVLEKPEEPENSQIFIREMWSHYKIKDFEIMNLKTENEEFKKLLENISEELSNHKFKLRDFEKIKKQNEEYLKQINEQELKIRAAEKKVQEKDLEVKYKLEEIEEISHMLRNSEDKRKLALDQLNDIESKYYGIKTKYVSMNKSQKDLKLSLDELSNTLSMKDLQIKDLTHSLSQHQNHISACQNEIFSLKCELEALRASKMTSNENLEFKLQQLEEENRSLKESLNDLRKIQIRSNTKRSETVINNKYFNKLTSQELSKVNQKVFELEEKLINKDLELEKLSKDCKYLVNQLETKDNIIEKVTKTVKDREESVPDSQSITFKSLEVTEELENAIIHISDVMNKFKCCKCFRFEDFCVNYPCGHLTCMGCVESVENCSSCSARISIMVPAGHCKEFFQFLIQGKKDLDRLKQLICGC